MKKYENTCKIYSFPRPFQFVCNKLISKSQVLLFGLFFFQLTFVIAQADTLSPSSQQLYNVQSDLIEKIPAKKVMGHSSIYPISIIVEPYEKTLFGIKKKLRNTPQAIKRFMDGFDVNEDFLIIKIVPKRNKKISKIYILPKDGIKHLSLTSSTGIDINAGFFETNIRWKIGEESEGLSSFFRTALTIADSGDEIIDLITYIPIDRTELFEFAYQEYFKLFSSVKGVYSGLEKIAKQDAFIRKVAARRAASLIATEQDLNFVLEEFPGLADLEAVLQAANALSCAPVIKIVEKRGLAGFSDPGLERLYAKGCNKSLADIDRYFDKFSEGVFEKDVFEQGLKLAEENKQLFPYFKKYADRTKKFINSARPFALKTIVDVQSARNYLEFFEEEEDVQAVYKWALKKLDLESIEELFKNVHLLSAQKCDWDNDFRTKLYSLKDYDHYFKLMDNCIDEDTKEKFAPVFKKWLLKTKEEKDKNKQIEVVLKYKYLYNDLSAIEDFAFDCGIAFDIITIDKNLIPEFKPACLRCMDTYEKFLLAKKLFVDDEPEVINLFISRISVAKELEKFVEKTKVNTEAIENKHFALINDLKSGLWHFKKYPTTDRRIELLEKIIRILAPSDNVDLIYKYLAEYLGEGGDPGFVYKTIKDCMKILTFANNFPQFQKQLRTISLECLSSKTANLFKAIYPNVDTKRVDQIAAQSMWQTGTNLLQIDNEIVEEIRVDPIEDYSFEFKAQNDAFVMIIFPEDEYFDFTFFTTNKVKIPESFRLNIKNKMVVGIKYSFLKDNLVYLKIDNKGKEIAPTKFGFFSLPESIGPTHIKQVFSNPKSMKIVTKWITEVYNFGFLKNKAEKTIVGETALNELSPLTDPKINSFKEAIIQRFDEIFNYLDS